jgi:hypothetical protein
MLFIQSSDDRHSELLSAFEFPESPLNHRSSMMVSVSADNARNFLALSRNMAIDFAAVAAVDQRLQSIVTSDVTSHSRCEM